jgi:hypothetical protein
VTGASRDFDRCGIAGRITSQKRSSQSESEKGVEKRFNISPRTESSGRGSLEGERGRITSCKCATFSDRIIGKLIDETMNSNQQILVILFVNFTS